MVRGPWDVMGPAAPSQTPAGIRRRYVNSILVVSVLLGIPLAASIMIGDFHRFYGLGLDKLGGLLALHHLPETIVTAIRVIVPCSVILGLVQAIAPALVWWEQKIAAHIQVRLGPMRVPGGPRFHGALQTIADGIKLLLKEDSVPAGADKIVHFLAPVIVVAPAYISYAPMPWGQASLTPVNLDVGVLFIMGVSGLSVIGLLMAGWGSNNKYAALGGLRAAAQVVSYEVPRVISILPVIMWAGTLSVAGIAAKQSGVVFGVIPRWFIFYPVVGQLSFIIFLICSIAETNRVPFDICEAESELVAGFNTEYAGMKWAMFFLAEYAYMFLASGLGVSLFLGGGAPVHPVLGFIPSYMWFLAKTLVICFLFMWIRWTYPRMRVDRLMEFCWKFLLPWSLATVVLAGFIFLARSH